MRCLPVLLLLVALARPLGAEPGSSSSERAGGPRVRPNDNRVATMLLDGLRRSPSLAALVDRIEASDVIVYIEIQPHLNKALSGCLTWIATAGGYRYVRASLSPNLSADALIAAMGHELQHAVEIVEDPSVTGPASLLALYHRIGSGGPPGSVRLDTHEARAAGVRVRQDLRGPRVAEAVPGGNAVSPLEWRAQYRQWRVPQLVQR